MLSWRAGTKVLPLHLYFPIFQTMTFRCWKHRSWDFFFSRVSSLCFLLVLIRYRSECMTLNEQHDFPMSGFLYLPQNLTCKIFCCSQSFPHCQNWKMSIHFPFFAPPRGRKCLFFTMPPKNLGLGVLPVRGGNTRQVGCWQLLVAVPPQGMRIFRVCWNESVQWIRSVVTAPRQTNLSLPFQREFHAGDSLVS